MRSEMKILIVVIFLLFEPLPWANRTGAVLKESGKKHKQDQKTTQITQLHTQTQAAKPFVSSPISSYQQLFIHREEIATILCKNIHGFVLLYVKEQNFHLLFSQLEVNPH